MKPIEEMTYEEFAAEFLNSDPRFQEFMEWARAKAISSGFTADDWQGNNLLVGWLAIDCLNLLFFAL